MSKTVCLVLACLVLLTVPALAAPQPPAIDSAPDRAVLVNLEQWLADNPVKAGEPAKMAKVIESPRSVMMFVNAVGFKLPPHFHTSADEIVMIYKGSGEMLINGEWTPVKAGDVHVNPRGAVHATRCAPDEALTIVSIFAPPQANGNDRVMVEAVSK